MQNKDGDYYDSYDDIPEELKQSLGNENDLTASNGVTTSEGFKENNFIPLDDLVYAPLHALAKSNQLLRAHIVESIKSMGTSQQNGTEETIHLNNINIAYEQVNSEGDDGYRIDNLQVQVPLISIVPITNLNVEKAEIDFSTEVNVEKDENGKCTINARICSPEQRDSDFLPKVTYKMQVSSIPATEGIMRLTDMLSSNQVAKKIDTIPIASDGEPSDDEQKEVLRKVAVGKAKIKKLRQLYQKIENMLEEQERMSQIRKETFKGVDDTNGKISEGDRKKYVKKQIEILDEIAKFQKEILNMEINGTKEITGMKVDDECCSAN